ncbi:MAG: aminoacyl-tRNA hydrolase [Proteobacteria bacterium]|nr:aminoacyl-tRNA hydrolase [Pseudomonadota bacterium]
MIRLLVGLGNPGAEYEGTRHNAGFWWVEAAARKLGAALQPQRQWYGLAARAATAHGPVWLLLPMTYMNLSGKAVAALARFYKIAPEEILVVHDELDLPPGEAKIKQGGGTAGHNGLKDIHAQLGSAAFWRLRLGIGHPGVRAEVVDYVLRRPAPDQREAIEQTVARTLGALDALLAGDMAAATQQIHTRKPPRPKPPRPAPAAPPPAGTAGGLGGDTEPTP